MKLTTYVLDLFYPRKCVFCRKVLKENEYNMCRACYKIIPFGDYERPRSNIDRAVAAVLYVGDVKKAVRRYKFEGMAIYADYFADVMTKRVKEDLDGEFDFITWVPLNRKRRKKRGYDQAELLARNIADNLDMEVYRTLVKTKNVKPQSGIANIEDRRKNVAGVYDIFDADLVRGKRILVVDDVTTSGATLFECAKTLRKYKAEAVFAVTLAITR